MTHIRGWAIVLIAALLAAGLLAPGAAHADGLAVEPARGGQTTVFTFAGAGFTPYERVSYWATVETGEVFGDDEEWELFADGEGRAWWTWTPPANAPFGYWLMVGFGNDSRVSRTANFVIERPTGLPATTSGASAQPAEGLAGTTFVFSASGYAPGEPVSYWASEPSSGTYGSDGNVVTADASGTATWSWATPADLRPGIWLMVGQGQASQASAVIRFTILAPQGPPPEKGVLPTQGPPGTTYTFSAGGYSAGERVTFWATAPGNDRLIYGDANYETRADDSGRATWSWTTPADARIGVWTMAGYGTSSLAAVQITFEVRAP